MGGMLPKQIMALLAAKFMIAVGTVLFFMEAQNVQTAT
jgi:hypothetical protein